MREKVDELIQFKQNVKEQMLGFLKLYEVKKEATLQELSHNLQQSEKFKK